MRDKIRVHGKVNLTMRFGNSNYPHTAFIADITGPFILGLDFLKKYDFKLDFENSKMHSKFEDITLLGLKTELETSQKITIKTDVSLSPRTKSLRPGLVALNRTIRFGLIDYIDSDSSKAGVLKASTVVDISKLVIPKRVANISDETRTVQEGEVITDCAPVTCVIAKTFLRTI
ncbi:retrovirus-related Pol polyprotein from transposon 412 [Trichonephila clavipes]|nr:retrovirus-related Pol polyprotein from transposon 412 [Trichonephila clavipes]